MTTILTIDELFRGSTHKASVFSPEAVSYLEGAVFMRPSRGGEVPYVRCLIRDKDVRLTPEEAVRQLYVYDLIHVEGYSAENIRLEHPVHFGREVKRADIVIFERRHPESEYIIVEVKKPKLLEGKAQLKSYCNATGAVIGVWTNGEIIECYHRKDPNYFEKVRHLPKARETLRDVIGQRWTINDLTRENKLEDGKITLKDIITDIEDEVFANAGVDVFDEVFKLIFTKLYDEMKSVRNESRLLEFGNYGDTDQDLKDNIQSLFDRAKEEWPGVFTKDDKITLNPSHLAVCVSSLQNVKLFNSNLDVVDDAFEYLMTKSQKGSKGQFFTPRYVIDMCVKMLNPQEHETMIDTAAGSCGFPVHTIFHVWGKIYDRLGLPRRNMFTAETKPDECIDYVRKKVFAIDFDPKVVRVARTLNLIAGDGQTNVIHLNTLDYMNWEETTRSEEWIDTYNEGWKGLRELRAVKKSNLEFMFDIVMANPPFAGDVKEGKIISQYELAKDKKGKYVSKIGRDILFIERNLQFLRPGGRMAIILPQGRFNNSSDKYIRDFIAERCRVLAVIGLHENVFKPHPGTKTSVLLVQKWDDELCPKAEDYPIFFATMRKPGKDNSGEKVYVKDEGGSVKVDGHNHPIVEHDLYNHEGLTEDGIAEAFIEFAKREGLSFFAGARFDEEKRYSALRGGLEVSEVMLSSVVASGRFDAEYHSGKSIAIEQFIMQKPHIFLKANEVVSGPFGSTLKSSSYMMEGDIPFVRIENLRGGFNISRDNLVYISHADNSRLANSQLFTDDLILSKVGSIGFFARVDDELGTCNISENNIGLKLSAYPTHLKHTMLVYLNSKHGQALLQRRKSGNVQPKLNVKDVCFIPIPKFSDDFSERISTLILESDKALHKSTALYTQAQTLLTSQLGQVPKDSRNTTTRSLSEVFSTGRLDAEYFMPKYDSLIGSLKASPTIDSSCRIHNANFTPQKGTQYRYIELADIGTYGNITGSTTADGQDLPTRARRIVRAGQVIVSSIEGSLQSCALITQDYDGALCSTGFYVLDSDSYNPETLLMLFKSEIVQSLMKRGCSGTILAAISEDELRKVRLPIIDHDTQTQIAHSIQQSFSLRKRSELLINSAVKAAELAVESSEQTAINFITQEEQP